MRALRMASAERAALLSLPLCMIACVSLDPEQMVPVVEPAKHHRGSVRLVTLGETKNMALGETKNTFGIAQVTDGVLLEILTHSILEARLFEAVEQGPGADYELTVIMNDSSLGTPRTEFIWELSRGAGSQNLLWEKSIVTTHEVRSRVVETFQEAVRDNLRQGLEAISRLDLTRTRR